jgi:hypothetical protein
MTKVKQIPEIKKYLTTFFLNLINISYKQIFK